MLKFAIVLLDFYHATSVRQSFITYFWDYYLHKTYIFAWYTWKNYPQIVVTTTNILIRPAASMHTIRIHETRLLRTLHYMRRSNGRNVEPFSTQNRCRPLIIVTSAESWFLCGANYRCRMSMRLDRPPTCSVPGLSSALQGIDSRRRRYGNY